MDFTSECSILIQKALNVPTCNKQIIVFLVDIVKFLYIIQMRYYSDFHALPPNTRQHLILQTAKLKHIIALCCKHLQTMKYHAYMHLQNK
jgi:hypothetical protein